MPIFYTWVPGTAVQAAAGTNALLLNGVTFTGVYYGLTYVGVVVFSSEQEAADAQQMWIKNEYNLFVSGSLPGAGNYDEQFVLNIVMTGDARTVRFFMQHPLETEP